MMLHYISFFFYFYLKKKNLFSFILFLYIFSTVYKYLIRNNHKYRIFFFFLGFSNTQQDVVYDQDLYDW